MRCLFSYSLLLAILLLTGWLTWQILSAGPVSEPAAVHQQTANKTPLSITGMTYNNYEADRLISHISVDQLQVQPRSFGIFRVRAVNEVILTHARIELHSYSDDAQSYSENLDPEQPQELSLAGAFSESIDGLATIRGMGRITRALFQPLSLSMLRDESPYLQLRAQTAELDIQKKTVEFQKALLIGRQADVRLSTAVLIWHEKHKRFHVPGEYQLFVKNRILTGKSAQLDADLNILVLPGGTPPKSD